MYRFDWYDDNTAIDPYNRHRADIPGFPEWQIGRKWDGSRDEVKVLHNGMHIGYSKETLDEIVSFIETHS